MMVITIEQGASGLWYGRTLHGEGPYKGLLIAGASLDEVLDQISPVIQSLRKAALERPDARVAKWTEQGS